MVDEKVRERVEWLRKELNYHNYRYYVLDSSVISDVEYDALARELRELEEKYPELATPDSPTRRIGGRQMADRLTPEQEEALQGLAQFVVRRLGEGASKDQVAEELSKELSWSRQNSEKFIENVRQSVLEELKATPEGRAAIARQYRKRMIRGFLWMAGGGLITWLTYTLASGGGYYFIFWGAILWGAIDFVRGLFGWLSNQ